MRIKLISLGILIVFLSNCFCQEIEKSFDHQLELSLSGGLTTQSNLEPKFGYMYGLNYTVRNSNKNVRLSVGGAINHYRTKTQKKYDFYNPKSDTFTVLHWNNVFYEFQLSMDIIIIENNLNKFYLTIGWNVGSYIARERTSKRYDESQGDKLISESIVELGQPIENILFGRGVGLGYERFINDKWSFFLSPNLIYKANVGGWGVYPFIFIGLNAGLQLNL